MTRSSFRIAVSVFSSALFVFATACGDDGNSGSSPGLSAGDAGTGGTTSAQPANCQTRCETKAGSCGLSAAQAGGICEELCATATAAQLNCLESTSCSALNAGETCGIGSGGSGGSGGSSAGKGGTGGSGGSSAGKGGTGGSGGSSSSGCASTVPYCDGDVAKSCDDSSGFPVNTNTTCSNGCENGVCKGKPKTLTLDCKLAKGSEPTSILTSDNTIASIFTLSADCDPSPSVNDSPDIGSIAPSSINPAPTGCTSTNVPGKLSVGSALNVISSMSSEEPPASTPCLDFMKDISDSGVTFVYEGVPYLNGGTIDKLTIKIKP